MRLWATMRQEIGKRVIVIGSSNAGKTTFASRLAAQTGLPFVELDALHWEAGWVEALDEVFRERVRTVIEQPSWVIEGNYMRQQQHISWPAADTIVWLDLDLLVVLRRCVRRSWRRWRTQEALYGGSNRENGWDHLMVWDTDKSLVAHIIKTHRTRRRIYEAMTLDPCWSHLMFIRLRSTAEIERWVATVPDPAEATDDPVENRSN